MVSIKETLIYSVWTALLAFFEEGAGRKSPAPLRKGTRALPNEKTQRFRSSFNQCFPKFPFCFIPSGKKTHWQGLSRP
ncbi:hypothetical protein LJC59_10020, partial [Desulfovibrio sp. OttesenSCG-928-A18]|nr:hypothetical protein [Desulfovibrio sp. OttesenSCG-928-A18]